MCVSGGHTSTRVRVVADCDSFGARCVTEQGPDTTHVVVAPENLDGPGETSKMQWAAAHGKHVVTPVMAETFGDNSQSGREDVSCLSILHGVANALGT